MKSRLLFMALTALATTVMFAFCILPESFADDSWTEAWRMEWQVPPEFQPEEELVELPDYDDHTGDYGHMFSPEAQRSEQRRLFPEQVWRHENQWRQESDVPETRNADATTTSLVPPASDPRTFGDIPDWQTTHHGGAVYSNSPSVFRLRGIYPWDPWGLGLEPPQGPCIPDPKGGPICNVANREY